MCPSVSKHTGDARACTAARLPAGSVSNDRVCVTLRTTTAGTTASSVFFHASLATCVQTRAGRPRRVTGGGDYGGDEQARRDSGTRSTTTLCLGAPTS